MNNHFYNMHVDENEREIKIPNGGYSKSEIDEKDQNVVILNVGDMRDLNLSEETKRFFEAKHRERTRLTKSQREQEK